MPRLKKSLEIVKFGVPFVEDLQRYLFYELLNYRKWIPTLVVLHPGYDKKWKATTKWWTIEFDGEYIIAKSDSPKIELHQGLTINMGHGRIEIQGRQVK